MTSMDLTRALKAEAPAPVKRPTIAAIQAEVTRLYRLDPIEMVSHRRAIAVARPRQVAMFLCRQLTVHSLPTIGRFFGGRDHSTVLHACKVIESLMFDDQMLRDDIGYIKARLA